MRTSDVRMFNGILLHRSCNIRIGYKVKCTYCLYKTDDTIKETKKCGTSILEKQ